MQRQRYDQRPPTGNGYRNQPRIDGNFLDDDDQAAMFDRNLAQTNSGGFGNRDGAFTAPDPQMSRTQGYGGKGFGGYNTGGSRERRGANYSSQGRSQSPDYGQADNFRSGQRPMSNRGNRDRDYDRRDNWQNSGFQDRDQYGRDRDNLNHFRSQGQYDQRSEYGHSRGGYNRGQTFNDRQNSLEESSFGSEDFQGEQRRMRSSRRPYDRPGSSNAFADNRRGYDQYSKTSDPYARGDDRQGRQPWDSQSRTFDRFDQRSNDQFTRDRGGWENQSNGSWGRQRSVMGASTRPEREALNEIAEEILESRANTILEFFEQYDCYRERRFKMWELQVMFPQVRIETLQNLTESPNYSKNGEVRLRALYTELERKSQLDRLRTKEQMPMKSVYISRFNDLVYEHREVLQRFTQYCNRDGDYLKAWEKFIFDFHRDAPHYPEDTYHMRMNKSCFRDMMKAIQEDILVDKMTNMEIICDRLYQYFQFDGADINAIQFVSALSDIMGQQPKRRPSAVIGKTMDQLVAEANNSDKMKNIKKIHPSVLKMKSILTQKGLIASLDSHFKSRQTLKIKDSLVGENEVLVSKVSELQALFKLCGGGLLQADQDQILKLYEVELASKPAPNASLTSAEKSKLPATIKEATENQENEIMSPTNTSKPNKLDASVKDKPEEEEKQASQRSAQPESQRSAQESNRAESKLSDKKTPTKTAESALPPLPGQEPAKPVEEKKEEDEYEYYEEEEKPEAAKEEKKDELEGGAPESLSVSQQQQSSAKTWFNYEKLKQDLLYEEPKIMKPEVARKIIEEEFFFRIKRWKCIKQLNFVLLFTKADRLGTGKASKTDVKQVLQIIWVPERRATPEQESKIVDATFNLLDNQDTGELGYEHLCDLFFAWANKDMLTDQSHELFNTLNAYRNRYDENKSLAQNFGLKFGYNLNSSDIRFELSEQRFKSIFQVASKERFSQQVKDQLNKVIDKCLNPQTKNVDLIKFKDLLGYRIDKVPKFELGRKMEQVVMAMQLANISVEYLERDIKDQYRGDNVLSQNKHDFIENMNNFFRYHVMDSDEPTIETLEEQCNMYQGNEGDQVNIKEYFKDLQNTMQVILFKERIFVKLNNLVNAKTSNIREGVEGYLQKRYGFVDSIGLSVDSFNQMLEDLNLIASSKRKDDDCIVEDERDQLQKGNEEVDMILQDYGATDDNPVLVQKLAADFILFNEHIRKIVASYCKKIDQFRKQENCSLLKIIGDIRRPLQDDEPRGRAMMRNEEEVAEVKWIHSYDFIQWFSNKQAHSRGYINHDLLNIFIEFFCIESQKKAQIYLPYFYEVMLQESQLKDDILKKAIASQYMDKIQKHCADVLEKLNQEDQIRRYFPSDQMEIHAFFDVLKMYPFEILEKVKGLPAEMPRTRYPPQGQIFLEDLAIPFAVYGDSNSVYTQKFCNQVLEVIECRSIKKTHFVNMQRQMQKTAQTDIREIIQQIKGSNCDLNSAGFDTNDFSMFCKFIGYKIDNLEADEATVLNPILRTFEKDLFDKVPCNDFIEELHNIMYAKDKDEVVARDVDERRKTKIKAVRFFQKNQEVIEEIGKEIEYREISDFGSFLKGNEFKKDGRISRADFYQVFRKFFENILGEGDVLSLIEMFDPTQSGSIPTDLVARELNAQIVEPQFKIKLESYVDQVVGETIVDPIEKEHKEAEFQKEEGPAEYHKMLLDLFCGIQLKQQNEDLLSWFSTFGLFKSGELTKNEFIGGIERLSVELSEKEKDSVYKHIAKTVNPGETRIEPANQTVAISKLVSLFNEDMPNKTIEERQWEILNRMADDMTEQKTLVQDVTDKFTDEQGFIQVKDFSYNLIPKFLKLEHVISQNMVETLQQKYLPDRWATEFKASDFVQDIQQLNREQPKRFKVFMTQAEFDMYGSLAAQMTDRADFEEQEREVVKPQEEPIYIPRSDKNTYFVDEFNGMDSFNQTGKSLIGQEFRSGINTLVPKIQLSSEWIQWFDQLNTSLRVQGYCVEEYFQMFGDFDPRDGIRKVKLETFTKAIKNLGSSLNWSNDNRSIQNLWEVLLDETNTVNGQLSQRYPRNPNMVSIDQLGQAVFQNSSIEFSKIDADTIVDVYSALVQQNLLSVIYDIINFFNFERDSTCSVQQFRSLLSDKLKLNKVLSQTKLDLLVQRYRVRPTERRQNLNETQSSFRSLNKTFEKKTTVRERLSKSAKAPKRVRLIKFVEDIGYQSRGIGILDQWAASVAEDIVKSFQVKLVIEGSRSAMSNNEVGTEMHAFFNRMCQNNSFIQFSHFQNAMTYLEMWGDEVQSQAAMEDFFKICCTETAGNPEAFSPNTLDPARLIAPTGVELLHFSKALEFFSRKPLDSLYSHVLEEFYISSKSFKVHVTGPTIQHMFDDYDLSQTGLVPVRVFVEHLESFYTGDSSDTVVRDLQFLATKYVIYGQAADEDKVLSYNAFIEDYDTIERMGFGYMCNQFDSIHKVAHRAIEPNKTSDQLEHEKQVRKLSDLPKENRSLYSKMSKYLIKNNLDKPYQYDLVNQDTYRQGYIEKEAIREVLKKRGMPISGKQLALIADILQTDNDDKVSYLEHVALLFGVEEMLKLQAEQSIEPFYRKIMRIRDSDRATGVDISKLKFRKELVDQLELKLPFLKALVEVMSDGKMSIQDQGIFSLFKRGEIHLDSKDFEILQMYLREARHRATKQINFNSFIKHFNVTENTSLLLCDIISQLTDKNIDLSSHTNTNTFEFSDFANLLDRAGVAVKPYQKQTLEKLFGQMSGGSESITKQTMLRILKRKFILPYGGDIPMGEAPTGPGKELSLDRAPFEVKEFIHHILNNNYDIVIRFKTEFKSSKRITEGDFKNYIKEVNFVPQQTTSETDSIVRIVDFFRSDTQPDLVSLSKIVLICRKIQPMYGSDPTGQKSKLAAAKTTIKSFPNAIQKILQQLNNHLKDHKISKQDFFVALDTNQNDYVDQHELFDYFTKQRVYPGLDKDSIRKLFCFLDSNEDGVISVNELSLFIQGAELQFEDKMKSFSAKFEQELSKEIEALFDRLDVNGDGALSENELVSVLKPMEPEQGLSLNQAREVVLKLDEDGNGLVSKKEFVKYVMFRQKKTILEAEDQMEDLRRLFKESLAEAETGDYTGEVQQLNAVQLKDLIKKAGYPDVTDAEVNDTFQEIDVNNNGAIDIDEFMTFLYVADKIKTRSSKAKDVVFNIRKASAKINAVQVFEMFSRLPTSFQPSFSQQEMEKRGCQLPSENLAPHFDYQSMKYQDLLKIKHIDMVNQKEYIQHHQPEVAFEVKLAPEAVMIPLLGYLNKENLPHCEVRACLFDMETKVYLSPFFIISAQAQPNAKTKKGDLQQISANWLLNDQLKQFVVKSKTNEESTHLVFEFLIYSEQTHQIRGVEPDRKSNQVTVGWTSIPIATAAKSIKHKLKLKGGSPFKEMEIYTEENNQKQGNLLSKLIKTFKDKDADGAPDRYLNVEIRPFNKLPESTQFEIAVLPRTCIVARPLLSLAVAFRQHCYKVLIKKQQEMKTPKTSLVISQFPKCFDCPDIVSAFSECWTIATKDCQTLKAVDFEKREELLEKFISEVYALVYDKKLDLKLKLPQTRTLPLGSEEYERRQLQLKLALLGDDLTQARLIGEKIKRGPYPNLYDEIILGVNDPKENEIVFIEDYKPFSLQEMGTTAAVGGGIFGLRTDKTVSQDQMQLLYAQMGMA